MKLTNTLIGFSYIKMCSLKTKVINRICVDHKG